jgi:hypothetical protein
MTHHGFDVRTKQLKSSATCNSMLKEILVIISLTFDSERKRFLIIHLNLILFSYKNYSISQTFSLQNKKLKQVKMDKINHYTDNLY